jgi:hypothetical protein
MVMKPDNMKVPLSYVWEPDRKKCHKQPSKCNHVWWWDTPAKRQEGILTCKMCGLDVNYEAVANEKRKTSIDPKAFEAMWRYLANQTDIVNHNFDNDIDIDYQRKSIKSALKVYLKAERGQ